MGEPVMHQLVRLARKLRCDSPNPVHAFIHHMRVGTVVALFILILFLLR